MGKHFYLKNEVHKGSPISLTMFNVYIQDVILWVTDTCTFPFSHKLLADDLMITINYQHLVAFFAMFRVNVKFLS